MSWQYLQRLVAQITDSNVKTTLNHARYITQIGPESRVFLVWTWNRNKDCEHDKKGLNFHWEATANQKYANRR